MKYELVFDLLSKHLNREDKSDEMAGIVRVLERPVRQFEPPDMLAAIKSKAVRPKQMSLAPLAAMVALAGLAAVVVTTVLDMPRSGRQAAPIPTLKGKDIVSIHTPSGNHPTTPRVPQTAEPCRHRLTRKHTHRHIHKANADLVAKREAPINGARVTIMDPAEFEADRPPSKSQTVTFSPDQPDSMPTAGYSSLATYRDSRPTDGNCSHARMILSGDPFWPVESSFTIQPQDRSN